MPREDSTSYFDGAIDLTRSDSAEEEVEETFEAVDRRRRFVRPSGSTRIGSDALMGASESS